MSEARAALALAGVLWATSLWPDAPFHSACDTEPRTALCQAAAVNEPTSLLFGYPLDINRARASSLEVLPGIGPARAAAIVAERCEMPFASVAALERVHGIGPRTRARLEAWLVAGDDTPTGCPRY